MVKVLLAPSVSLALDLVRSQNVAVSVEAEYGSHVVEGHLYTAAHHQATGRYMGRHLGLAGRPAPCNDEGIPLIQEGVILVSHLDLDSYGGALRAMGGFEDLFQNPAHQGFWNLAEFVDTQGAHKIAVSGACTEDIQRIQAFQAWLMSGIALSRTEISDVTDNVREAGSILTRILQGDTVLLAAGDAYQAQESAINRETFVQRKGDLIIRRVDRRGIFVNSLYTDPEGHLGCAIATRSTVTGSVTISLADPIPGVSCREIVQQLWGSEAGGHTGIAGSPRERFMTEEDFEQCIQAFLAVLKNT